MIHYSCDQCKRPLDPDEDLRYVVKMEVYAVMDPVEESDDDDRDSLLEIQDILQRMDDGANDKIGDDVYRSMRFDLCADCRRKFVAHPLGRTAHKQFDFSQN